MITEKFDDDGNVKYIIVDHRYFPASEIEEAGEQLPADELPDESAGEPVML